jgi:hypothetical protein
MPHRRTKPIKHRKKPPASSSPGSPGHPCLDDKNIARKQTHAEPDVTDDTDRKIDGPGFDLGGPSDDTHAGTGLGLGDDASDTPGDRQLPVRRTDSTSTIPRWVGPSPNAWVDLNCRSVVALSYGFGQRMADQGRGGIVLFGPLVGFQGAPLAGDLCHIQGLGAELRPLGISVLAVAPGPVGTGFAGRAGMQMGQSATPQSVARSALAAFARGGTVRPGALARLLGWSLAMLPVGAVCASWG